MPSTHSLLLLLILSKRIRNKKLNFWLWFSRDIAEHDAKCFVVKQVNINRLTWVQQKRHATYQHQRERRVCSRNAIHTLMIVRCVLFFIRLGRVNNNNSRTVSRVHTGLTRSIPNSFDRKFQLSANHETIRTCIRVVCLCRLKSVCSARGRQISSVSNRRDLFFFLRCVSFLQLLCFVLVDCFSIGPRCCSAGLALLHSVLFVHLLYAKPTQTLTWLIRLYIYARLIRFVCKFRLDEQPIS